MRHSRGTAADVLNNPILVGTVTILVVMVAVYLSYIAENGLPFVPTYNVNVQVADAAELVKNADVRIGGARVGQVLTIKPEPASSRYPHPYAQLGLALQSNLNPLPSDTRYQVRLASVLGGKYLELFPGSKQSHGVPDGGTLTVSTNPRLNHNIPFVDLDTAFATFGPKTQRGFRNAVAELSAGFAGRGAQFNDAIYSLYQLIGPLQQLLRTFASSSTHLSQFISGLAATTRALAPVSPIVGPLLSDAATTFQALDVPALGETLDQLPPTETLGTTVLTQSLPVLAETARLVQALKPGAALLPEGARRLDDIIVAATPVFRQVPKLSSELETAFGAVDALARDPASIQTFKVLGSTDLASLGASAFIGLGAILRSVAGDQFACNVTGLWVRNFASALSEGDSGGGWLRFAPILNFDGGTQGQTFEQPTPSADLHLNPYPQETSSECQGANDVYKGAQLIGDPGPSSTLVDNTAPPPGVLAEGKKAGLVP